ncbi:hypothetical protein, partial [Leisingera sp. F5]|uniref:hypothetical protein n=1 Tax=Leisingera sp. F5 TaxID=1813816 RepID=UPI0025C16A69
GGSIRFRTAAFRAGEYPTSSSYPAHLKNRGKVEQRTTSLTQGGMSQAPRLLVTGFTLLGLIHCIRCGSISLQSPASRLLNLAAANGRFENRLSAWLSMTASVKSAVSPKLHRCRGEQFLRKRKLR